MGQFPKGASPYGVLDMAGNVWEWTGSLYRPYPYDAAGGREGFNSGEVRSVRSGSYLDFANSVRSATRVRDFPDQSHVFRGFRVVSAGS